MNNNPIIKPEFVPNPFKYFCMTIGYVPTAYKDSLDYYEQLLWLIKFLENKVIPTIDNNALAVTELQNLYIELKNYVEHYFENLDVQEEINNKLDDMVEQGTLQEIIAEYLNANALWCFDNVDDMKNASNLIAGSFAKTLGFYELNDKGEALYKIREITNQDVVDNASIIALNDENLVAELVITNKSINVLQFGAIGDGNTDCTSIFNKVIDYANANNRDIYIPSGKYKIQNDLHDIIASISIYGDECGNGAFELKSTILDYRSSLNYLFNFPVAERVGGTIKNLSFKNMNNLYKNKCIKCVTSMSYESLIKNCNFYQYGNCIYINDTHGVVIDGCAFVKCGSDVANASKDEFAIYIYRSVDVSLTNLMIDHSRYQLYIEHDSYVYITNSHFEVSNLNIVNGKSSIYCDVGNYGHVSFSDCSFIGLSYKTWMYEASLNINQVPFMIYGTYVDITNCVLSCGSGSGQYSTPYGKQCKFADLYYGTISNCKIKSPSYMTNSFNLPQSKMINCHIQCDLEVDDFSYITKKSRIIYSRNNNSKDNYLQYLIPTSDPQVYPTIYPTLYKWYSDDTHITTNKSEINFERIKEYDNLQEYNTIKIQSNNVLTGLYKLKVKSYGQASLIYEGYFRINNKSIVSVEDIYKNFGGGYSISIFTDDDSHDIYIQVNMLTYRTNVLIFEIEGLEGHPDIIMYYVPSINSALQYTNKLDITN